MFKRQSGGGNTLFNYFTKVNSSSSNSNGSEETSIEKKTPKKSEKRQLDSSEEENHDDNIQPAKRVRKANRIEDSDDSGDESVTKTPSKTASKLSSFNNTPTTKGSLNITPNKTPSKSSTTTPKKSAKKLYDDTNGSNQDTEDGIWTHEKLDFLKPDKIRDKNGKSPNDPNYDPKTLYVPGDFLAKQTPGHRQWWLMKSDHYDCVLFFKVGKFYELYHMDAVIGVQELGFSYMKGEFAHSGFPESAYGRMLSTLVDHGYKVARVEQTETPELMAERLRSTPGANKGSKVVKREICQITNSATRIQGLQDTDIKQPFSWHLLAVIENQTSRGIEFGVCFVDTSTSKFYLSQFEDDDRFSRLLTMLAQYPPAVILEERKQLSSQTRTMLKNAAGSASLESLSADTQFYSSTKTLQTLLENEYFLDKQTDKLKIPAVLQQMISADNPLNTTCKREYDLALRCLGACIWYLKDCCLDIQTLTVGKFEEYIPPDINNTSTVNPTKVMVLDACTLSSLNLLGPGETLEATLDHCCTPFGKRLLHQWICRPICNTEEIKDRQNAISELTNRPDVMQSAREILSQLPDIERLISKIHWMGNALRAKNHPDNRAIFYEEKSYSKKKIKDFTSAISSFEKAMTLCSIFSDVKSKMLRKHIIPGEVFPDIADTLAHFKASFDFEEAETEGRIIPQVGIDAEYDETITEMNNIKQKLDEYLESQEKYFGCKLSYTGTDKKRFQLEVPEHATKRANHNYSLEGTKKGSKPSKRYTTNETKSLLRQMMDAEAKNTAVLKDLNRRIFEKFSAKYEEWSVVCYCLAVIDVLLSFAEYTNNQSINMCVPNVLPFCLEPRLIVKDGIHPYVPNPESFVPNDAEFGTDKAHSPVLILTGPNMGGKSTLMRQVALLTIMAQMGCHVPASEMELTLVDRIFTRLGAHDDIMAGNSTFLVELREASAILQHSTRNSLVLLDELGRGTSTFDGTAIATAYVDYLVKVNCRAMFSTHYYTLLDYFKNNNDIQLGHMACKVESDEDDANQETVIFMYKMIAGPCPKSYGFNAARLAGIPGVITHRASKMSKKFEADTTARKMFRKIFGNTDGSVRDVLSSIC